MENFYAGVKGQKCILPTIRSLLKIENLPYFFLGRTIFSKNLVYDVVFGAEFYNGIFEYIPRIFTRYFDDNMIFREFLIIFLLLL